MEIGQTNSPGDERGIFGLGFNRWCIALLLICVIITGCALVKLKQEVR